jgi:hypothetical protein
MPINTSNRQKQADARRVRKYLRQPPPCVLLAASLFKETDGQFLARFAKSGVKVVVVADEHFHSVLFGMRREQGQYGGGEN